MTDPKVEEGLRRLAERGTPRGADRVFEAATRADAVVRPLGGADAPVAGARSTWWPRYAIAAVVITVVAVGGMAYALRDDGDTTPVSAGSSNFCEVMAASVWNSDRRDRIYVHPGASPGVVADIGAVLRTRPEVGSVRYVDAEETYQEFAELFRDDDSMLQNVRPNSLPTSYDVVLVDPGVEAEASLRAAMVDATGVYDVKIGAPDFPRVIDLLDDRLGDSVLLRSDVLVADLLDGLRLRLGALEEGSAPTEILRDIDTVAEAVAVGGFDTLEGDHRIEVLRASERVDGYVDATCDLPDPFDLTELELPQPVDSTVATTEPEPEQGD